jgi:hypothetical protein
LGRDGEDPESTKIFRRANNGPGNLTLTTGTGFLTSPKEGAPTLVNGLNHRNRKDAGTHGVSHHCREHIVDQKKAVPNCERATPPGREF